MSAAAWPTLADFATATPWASTHELKEKVPLRITDRLFIVGFPFGDRGTWPLAIWTQAPVASEPLARHDGLPAFLVDARSRRGQSGSPVFLHIRPGDPVWMRGGVVQHEEQISVVVGVYSGRLNERSDLGLVWTSEAILDALTQARAGVRASRR